MTLGLILISSTLLSGPYVIESKSCDICEQNMLKHLFIIVSVGFKDAATSLNCKQPEKWEYLFNERHITLGKGDRQLISPATETGTEFCIREVCN